MKYHILGHFTGHEKQTLAVVSTLREAESLRLFYLCRMFAPFGDVTIMRQREHHIGASCATCARYRPDEMFPPHDASDRCESGKHNHCSCDVCF